MLTNRRKFLKNSAATGAVAVAVGTGLLAPRTVLAEWSKTAFDATDMNTALTGSVGGTAMTDSADIELKTPEIAENGAVVPVTVISKIPGTETITILVPGNNTPLAATFTLNKRTEGFVSTRIKMGKTSDVVAVIKAGGKLYTAKKEVKVTIGGCGG